MKTMKDEIARLNRLAQELELHGVEVHQEGIVDFDISTDWNGNVKKYGSSLESERALRDAARHRLRGIREALRPTSDQSGNGN